MGPCCVSQASLEDKGLPHLFNVFWTAKVVKDMQVLVIEKKRTLKYSWNACYCILICFRKLPPLWVIFALHNSSDSLVWVLILGSLCRCRFLRLPSTHICLLNHKSNSFRENVIYTLRHLFVNKPCFFSVLLKFKKKKKSIFFFFSPQTYSGIILVRRKNVLVISEVTWLP